MMHGAVAHGYEWISYAIIGASAITGAVAARLHRR